MRFTRALECCLIAVYVWLCSIGSSLAGGGGPCGSGMDHDLPEPTTLALLGVGVAGILVARRHLRNRKK